jgi:hypothetical protein
MCIERDWAAVYSQSPSEKRTCVTPRPNSIVFKYFDAGTAWPPRRQMAGMADVSRSSSLCARPELLARALSHLKRKGYETRGELCGRAATAGKLRTARSQ